MLQRRHFVTFVALAAIAATWGLMLAFSWSATLGAIAFAPWVALIGFDAGAVAGTVAVALAVTLWLVGANADHLSFNDGQIAVRSGSLVVLAPGLGTRRAATAEERSGTAFRRNAPVGADRLDVGRNLPHRRKRADSDLEQAAAPADTRARYAA